MSRNKVGVLPLPPTGSTAGTNPAFTTTTNSDAVEPFHTNRTFEVYGTTSSGSGSAVVNWEVRNSENAAWSILATITVTLGTSTASGGATSSAAWKFVRANVTTLSGTGAQVFCDLGTAPL